MSTIIYTTTERLVLGADLGRPSVPSRSDRSARVDGNTRARRRSRARLLTVVWMTNSDLPEIFSRSNYLI